jgi:secondary thiamine-phosphate synthase enzyme
MTVQSVPLAIRMAGGTDMANITQSVAEAVAASKVQDGIVTVFIKHTTASIMIIEDEPGIRADTKTFWDRVIPPDPLLQHNIVNSGEDNGHSHLRGQLQGPSITIPFAGSALLLGTWQQIVLVDFDTRSRTRDLVVQVLGE